MRVFNWQEQFSCWDFLFRFSDAMKTEKVKRSAYEFSSEDFNVIISLETFCNTNSNFGFFCQFLFFRLPYISMLWIPIGIWKLNYKKLWNIWENLKMEYFSKLKIFLHLFGLAKWTQIKMELFLLMNLTKIWMKILWNNFIICVMILCKFRCKTFQFSKNYIFSVYDNFFQSEFFNFSFWTHSLTISCKTAPLSLNRSVTFKKVGTYERKKIRIFFFLSSIMFLNFSKITNAKPIFNSGCHCIIDPP